MELLHLSLDPGFWMVQIGIYFSGSIVKGLTYNLEKKNKEGF